jgi:hypothetical protein
MEETNDRRRHPRCRVAATVVVCQEERYLGTYLVENLSAGGLLLIGEVRANPGQRLRMLLCLGGGRRIKITGEVCRRATQGANVHHAIRFRSLPPGTEAVLAEVVRSELAPRSSPRLPRPGERPQRR